MKIQVILQNVRKVLSFQLFQDQEKIESLNCSFKLGMGAKFGRNFLRPIPQTGLSQGRNNNSSNKA